LDLIISAKRYNAIAAFTQILQSIKEPAIKIEGAAMKILAVFAFMFTADVAFGQATLQNERSVVKFVVEGWSHSVAKYSVNLDQFVENPETGHYEFNATNVPLYFAAQSTGNRPSAVVKRHSLGVIKSLSVEINLNSEPYMLDYHYSYTAPTAPAGYPEEPVRVSVVTTRMNLPQLTTWNMDYVSDWLLTNSSSPGDCDAWITPTREDHYWIEFAHNYASPLIDAILFPYGLHTDGGHCGGGWAGFDNHVSDVTWPDVSYIQMNHYPVGLTLQDTLEYHAQWLVRTPE
jgi:hypothetical protein